jgi:hypothetical protein
MNERLLKYINAGIIGVGLYILFIFLFSRTLADYDMWGYLSFGRVFWESGYFPYRDIFSYTPTNSLWVYHEWLTGVILYPIMKYAGSAGIQLLRYNLIVLTIYIMYRTAIEKGTTPTIAFFCISLGLILMSWGYTPIMRAQIFTYLFFAMTIYIIEIARKRDDWHVLLWVLLIMVFWCNVHGGFLAGLCLIALYALGDGLSRRKFIPLIIIFIAACLVTLINPYGIEYWKYLIHAVTMSRPNIDEWHSVLATLRQDYYVIPSIIFIVLSTISLVAIIVNGKRYLTEFLILAAVTYLGYKHIRHTVFLGIVFGVFLPVILVDIKEIVASKPIINKRMICITPILLIVFYSSINLFVSKFSYQGIIPTFSLMAPSPIFPAGALKWMAKNSFKGNILPSFQWGQYIIWATHPKCKVAMDGRYETVYPDYVQKEYFDFHHAKNNWELFLDKYPPDALLLMPNTKIYSLMLKEPSWKVVYSDEGSVLFLRADYNSRKKTDN